MISKTYQISKYNLKNCVLCCIYPEKFLESNELKDTRAFYLIHDRKNIGP